MSMTNARYFYYQIQLILEIPEDRKQMQQIADTIIQLVADATYSGYNWQQMKLISDTTGSRYN
jgi:hypothetical protein